MSTIAYAIQRSRRVNSELQDRSVSRSGKEKTSRIDLGLALLSACAVPGICYTREEIAAWCGCTMSAIYLIELRALKKIRNALQFRDRAMLSDLRDEFYDRQTRAVPKERKAA